MTTIDPRITDHLAGFGVTAPTLADIAWAAEQLGIAAPADAAAERKRRVREAERHERAMDRQPRRRQRRRYWS